jgi:hypothetical protein
LLTPYLCWVGRIYGAVINQVRELGFSLSDLLFSLMEKGNLKGLRKKDQARPDALPPRSGQVVAGQANTHGESFDLIARYVFDVNG